MPAIAPLEILLLGLEWSDELDEPPELDDPDDPSSDPPSDPPDDPPDGPPDEPPDELPVGFIGATDLLGTLLLLLVGVEPAPASTLRHRSSPAN